MFTVWAEHRYTYYFRSLQPYTVIFGLQRIIINITGVSAIFVEFIAKNCFYNFFNINFGINCKHDVINMLVFKTTILKNCKTIIIT